jgi:hypothetical protein
MHGSWQRRDGVRRRIVGVFDASASPLKEGYAMTGTNVFKLSQPGMLSDLLTEVLRNGARILRSTHDAALDLVGLADLNSPAPGPS